MIIKKEISHKCALDFSSNYHFFCTGNEEIPPAYSEILNRDRAQVISIKMKTKSESDEFREKFMNRCTFHVLFVCL